MAHDSRYERPTAEADPTIPAGTLRRVGLLPPDTVGREPNGYRNLIQLSKPLRFLRPRYKPRIDWELLERYQMG